MDHRCSSWLHKDQPCGFGLSDWVLVMLRFCKGLPKESVHLNGLAVNIGRTPPGRN